MTPEIIQAFGLYIIAPACVTVLIALVIIGVNKQ